MNAQLIDQRTGEVLELTKQRVIVGRAGTGVDIAVKDTSVSRCHCSLCWENDGWYVVDLDSINHTYVNKKQLKPRVKYLLRYGDELRLANVCYRFEQGSAPGAYDIFISFKNSDRNGCLTRDSQMAEELYQALKEKGLNPFFSKYSIDEATRADYVDAIDRALESATILVAVGTSRENLSSKWVKSEINQFRAIMNEESDQTRSIISYRSTDFLPNELPSGLRQFQSYDDLKAVVRFVEMCLKKASGFRNEGGKTVLTYEESTVEDPSCVQDHARLQIGDILYDHFQVLHFIGEGGMSRVYLAYDMRMGKRVAIKEYQPGKSDIAAEMIRTEIELLKTLHHPAIPGIYDIVEHGDSLIIVMEYVEGRSLDRVLSERISFPEERVLEFAKQLVEVLDYLHNRPSPIIYRDMKPANLILQPDGTLKLIDFGAARIYRDSASSDTLSLGTVGYAAPEQFGSSAQTTPRTDIYGLGVTLHQLVTGKNPALPPYEILPIRQINPNLSRELESIIEKCTQRDPDKRYQSAKELLRAIERASKPGMLDTLTAFFKFPRASGRKPAPPVPRKQTSGASAGSNVPPIPGSANADGTIRPIFPTVVLTEAAHHPAQAEAEMDSSGDLPDRNDTGILSDHGMSETVEKLLAMDVRSRQLILELIDRLSDRIA